MSKLIALRLPDDVYAEVRKRMGARGQSHFIINALRVYLEQIEPGNPASWQQLDEVLRRSTTSLISHSPACKCLMCKGGA